MGNTLNVLVKTLQQGNIDVFDEIYALTHKAVYYTILGILHDPSLSEDIMQDTYIKFLKKTGAYHEDNFVAYLTTIARNLAINEYNSRKRTELSDDLEWSRNLSYSGSIEIDAEHKQLIEIGLSALNEFEKSVVLLYNISNLTHKEIAAVLQKPIGTITWTYSKALKKIREAIKEE